jgi:hypothetical protein
MTRDEFERGYCARSGVTVEWFRQHRVALPCACEADGCEGWAAISLDPLLLLHHLCFQLPEREALMGLEMTELRAVTERADVDGK